ncbi:ribonuclease H [Prevotella dentalis DSM 3688]|uniref:Ribonuclease H n=1 Tax=Prevotella dentalis (strain ATCC 49559 / DSM 3688 / JCM 13448 / NCTC 12043 / ES 2772) TaxID=908937 RepID=F9D2U9_PREDD|nr:ribonuclease H [Prevotella dentalis DSM 3688]
MGFWTTGERAQSWEVAARRPVGIANLWELQQQGGMAPGVGAGGGGQWARGRPAAEEQQRQGVHG